MSGVLKWFPDSCSGLFKFDIDNRSKDVKEYNEGKGRILLFSIDQCIADMKTSI